MLGDVRWDEDRIALLGTFAVWRGGAQLTGQQVGSRKARTLLKRLLVARRRVVAVPALVEAVWPDRPPHHPDRHLATLVSRLRASLGSESIVRVGDGYRFGDGYTIDLDEAERLVDVAETRLAARETGPALTAAERALELLGRGDLLADDPYAEWAALARTSVEVLAQRARTCAWAAALALGRWDTAARSAEAVLAREPFHEQACRALMRAHRGRGEPGLALAAYERLRDALASELGTDPAGETRALHLAILRGLPDDQPGDEPGGQPGAAPVPEPVAHRRDHEFVGRQAELEGLHRAWSRATTGEGGMALLLGEAGIGKTALATELVGLAASTGATIARARCYETERSLFLQPVVDALRPVVVSSSPDLVRRAAGDRASSLATLIAEVGTVAPADPPRSAGDPELERRRLFEAVTSFIRALATPQPVLLFLDDLHLAGSSTLDYLHFLVRRIVDDRVLVLATARLEEDAGVLDALGSRASQWELGPLPAGAVRELAARNGLADLAGRIMEQTSGHSLFVVETLRAMAEQPADPTGAVVPETLRGAVLARMRRAGPQVEELLRAAATLGGSLELAVLAALTDEPVVTTARHAEAACRARLLQEAGDGYEFANELIQEIAYQTTPLPTRIAWHRRAAELLAGSPEAVAVHATRAGDWSAAVEAYLRAVEAATRQYANRDALRLLEQALQAAHRTGDEVALARVTLARGRVREALADFQGAYEDFSTVVTLARANDRADLERAALSQLGGDMLVGLGRPTRECAPYLEAALSLAEETGDLPGQIDILGRLAVIWTNRLRFDRARAHAQRATALADELSGHDHGGTEQALALDAVKTSLAYLGDVAGLGAVLPQLQARLHRYDQRLHRYRREQLRVWAVFESAFPALAAGRWTHARERIEQALAQTRESGYLAYEPPFLAHLAWAERAQGCYGSALRHGRQAVELADRIGHPWWVVLARVMHGWTLTELGLLDEAVEWLERGLVAAERDATEGYLVRCLGHLAWACGLRGERERARELAGRVEVLLDQMTGGWFLHGAHAVVAAGAARVTVDEPEAAARLLEPVGAAAGAAGWVEPLAWADLLRARCRLPDDRAGAAALAGEALAVARRGGLPGLTWQAHGVLAASDVDDAGAHLTHARSIVQGLAGSLREPAERDRFCCHAEATLAALSRGSWSRAGDKPAAEPHHGVHWSQIAAKSEAGGQCGSGGPSTSSASTMV